MSNDHENPWASQPNRRPPPSSGPRRRNDKTPPFGQMNNPFATGPRATPKLFAFMALVLVGIWLASGLYRVLPEENAVLLHFGKYTQTITEPGLHYHLPSPIETVLKPNVTFERRLELGYRGAPFQGVDKQDIPEESMMLTGDANIVDLDFVVQWKVGDAKQFLFNIRDPEATLKRIAESAMREVVGQNELQDIITDRREEIAARVKGIMQDILKSYNAGVVVTQVLIQDASVPPPVLDAFEDVIRANQQAETMRNQALKYRNEIVPRAQGDAISMVKEAEGYKESIVAGAQGDAQRFEDIYKSYAQSKEVTRTRMYLDAWQSVLQNTDATILDSAKSGTVPYVNIDAMRRKNETQAKEITP